MSELSDQENDATASDAEIRQLLKIGNVEAMALLWDRYADSLYRLLLSIMESPADAEDVLQNVFLKITANRVHISEAKNIGAYIYRLTQNAGFDAFRKRKKDQAKRQHNESYIQQTLHSENSNNELPELINKALDNLPQEQRSVIMLKIYDQKTFNEIAEILEISANTCASRYRYAMDKLRSSLEGQWP